MMKSYEIIIIEEVSFIDLVRISKASIRNGIITLLSNPSCLQNIPSIMTTGWRRSCFTVCISDTQHNAFEIAIGL